MRVGESTNLDPRRSGSSTETSHACGNTLGANDKTLGASDNTLGASDNTLGADANNLGASANISDTGPIRSREALDIHLECYGSTLGHTRRSLAARVATPSAIAPGE